MISGCATNQNYDMAIDCFREMQVAGMKPNRVTQNYDMAIDCFREMQVAGMKPNRVTLLTVSYQLLQS